MKFAIHRGAARIWLLAFVLSGCSFLEPPPDFPQPVQPVMVRVDSRGDSPAQANIDEIVSYVRYLQGLPADALRAELAKLDKELGAAPSLMQRIKLSFALAYGTPSPQYQEKALSLLGDSAALADSQPELAVWVRHAKHMLTRLVAQAEREQKLERERKDIVRNNDALVRELAERKTEITRLEKQLSELKSIETSIIQRKSGEETTPP